ncbi:ceramidase like protein [Polychaeton citri CBS 116435]|uniref:Neutral ceramidase n=1 Tax=Polychaeton citri CBS 116435 TaxID=1314669 RepID=A0A9P4Q3E9_9PEZI|nr:ceramidase like protein [Polychaeton citri CBS 116435]
MAQPKLIAALSAAFFLICSCAILFNGFNIGHGISLSTVLPDQDAHRTDDQAHPSSDAASNLLLGVGKSDITGPVVEINFMGYADPAQLGTGLRQRLYSRAFIVASADTPEDRFVYLVLDTQSGDTATRHGILKKLSQLGGEYSLYGNQNVAVTGTHSHSGPGAWLNYLLPQITSRGFDRQSYDAIVDGAVESIKKAHASLAPGKLSFALADLYDANINRSPYAYLKNPKDEREKYQHDVEKEMSILLFSHTDSSSAEKAAGALTWFPVHGTSMYGNNTLVTGDNKGVAAYLVEQAMADQNPDFVAGFSQANVGDTSPNTLGAYCEYGDFAGELCDFKTSLCGNKTQPCHGRGPYYGRDDAGTASTYEIGRKQAQAALDVLQQRASGKSVFDAIDTSTVKSSHHFADLSRFIFTLPNGTLVRTCPAAMGYSFAAGTTDGPGAFDFKQAQPGDPHANPLWSLIGNRVATPNETQIACQEPKPILLDVGESENPYAWSPNIVDIQALRVGNLYIIVSPGEATTMSGRRWKKAVAEHAAESLSTSVGDVHVVLGGPANTYAHYITTQEEYSIQRYEGASTLYGPHTLDAYINLTLSLSLPNLDASATSHPCAIQGPEPPINTNRSLSFITGVVRDGTPIFKSFGDVSADVHSSYVAGESIEATFVGANPRNNLRLADDETFAAVEKFDVDQAVWKRMRDDADWSLVFEWDRTSTILATSQVKVRWETEWEIGSWVVGGPQNEDLHGDLAVRRDAKAEALKGRYRLKYYGDAKSIGGDITPFQGTSSEFVIQ